jgi:hypothetical protein
MTIHWKALEECFLMVPIFFPFIPFRGKNSFHSELLKSRLEIDASWTPQSDLALFTLGLNLAKSTSLTMRRKVANHSP